MPRKRKVPSLTHHKRSGQGVVRLNGKDFYCGRWGTEDTQREYDRLIKQWLANGRSLVEPTPEDVRKTISVAEVIEAFWMYAQQRYEKAGSWRVVLRTINDMYGDEPAAAFGPVKLRAIMQALVERGNCRQYVNKNMHRTRKVFKWAAAHELIDVVVFQRLEVVEALAKGHTAAPEGKKVEAVGQDVVDATLAELSPMVADMACIQRLIGCRPGELVVMRPCDVDRTESVWLYTPESHKTEHLGQQRIVLVGPRAQMILQRYLLKPDDELCFPMKRQSYTQAITRAAKRAGVPRWTPNQLRHTRGTEVRHQYGLEASQVILGHANAATTELYAEKNLNLAIEVAKKTG